VANRVHLQLVLAGGRAPGSRLPSCARQSGAHETLRRAQAHRRRF
jgi:hypothetical protein